MSIGSPGATTAAKNDALTRIADIITARAADQQAANHLDLEAITQLEQALDRFVGTVVLVTHDRRPQRLLSEKWW